MKLSVFNPVLYSMKLEECLKYLNSLGVHGLELGVGGYPGTGHASAQELIKSAAKVKELKELLKKYEMELVALSVHGNGVHPDKNIAAKFTQDFDNACIAAQMLGVDRVVTFSGCPGDRKSEFPNWVTCTWPNDFSDLLKYQWDEVLLPYWTKEAQHAKNHGVKVCFEMHPGFCVYNVQTMLKIRKAVGDTVGANLDPSHLFWQGADIVTVVKTLADAIYFFHAKDTMFNNDIKAVNGVLDTGSYANELQRAWLFRSVGYGGVDWKNVITALRMVGYNHAISIEHEDSLMTPKEGLEKAVAYLKDVMIFDSSKTDLWWISFFTNYQNISVRTV